LPKLSDGENILVAAHGNSLRSLVMQLDHLSKEEVIALEIPTGAPIIYSFDGGKEPIAKENLFE
jgi:2,3-bisphosphoglycerate-dependent phosphoglycerate mutase